VVPRRTGREDAELLARPGYANNLAGASAGGARDDNRVTNQRKGDRSTAPPGNKAPCPTKKHPRQRRHAPSGGRSAISPWRQSLERALDARTALGRHVAELTSALEDQLGGRENITPAQGIDTSEMIAKYKRGFFANSARPDFIMEIDGVSNRDLRRYSLGSTRSTVVSGRRSRHISSIKR